MTQSTEMQQDGFNGCEDNCMLTRTLKIHGKVGANTMETRSYFIQNVG